MTTTQEVIRAFFELPQEEQEEVRNVLNATNGDADFLEKAFNAEYVPAENYSEEDQAVLDQCQEDAKKGINMIGPFAGKEAINYLRKLRNASTI